MSPECRGRESDRSSNFKEWKHGTVHISLAPGKVEGQKPGINIRLPREPDIFGRNTIAEAAAVIRSVLESRGRRGGEDRTALGSGGPFSCP